MRYDKFNKMAVVAAESGGTYRISFHSVVSDNYVVLDKLYEGIAALDPDNKGGNINSLMDLVMPCITESGIDYDRVHKTIVLPSTDRHNKTIVLPSADIHNKICLGTDMNECRQDRIDTYSYDPYLSDADLVIGFAKMLKQRKSKTVSTPRSLINKIQKYQW